MRGDDVAIVLGGPTPPAPSTRSNMKGHEMTSSDIGNHRKASKVTKGALALAGAFILGWYASVRFTDSIPYLGDIDESSGIG